MPMTYPAPCTYYFYLPDSDRSCGWTNHGYVLQFAFTGYGTNPADAMAEAIKARREDFEIFDDSGDLIGGEDITLTAIRRDQEREITQHFPTA